MGLKEKIITVQNKMVDNLKHHGIKDVTKTIVNSDGNITTNGSTLSNMADKILSIVASDLVSETDIYVRNGIMNEDGTTSELSDTLTTYIKDDGTGYFKGQTSAVYGNINPQGDIESADGLFEGCTKLVGAKGSLTKVKSIKSLFKGCTSLVYPPKIDMSNVTDTTSLFEGCTNLKYFNQWEDHSLINWGTDETTNITNVHRMFKGCTGLEYTIPFDTSHVTDFSEMYMNCKVKRHLPIGRMLNTPEEWYQYFTYDFSSGTNFESMFENCVNFTGDFTSSNISNASHFEKPENVKNMFKGCTSLTSLPLINMANVTQADGFLTGCTSLSYLRMKNVSISLNLSDCPLTEGSVSYILQNIGDGTGKTLTLGTTNLAKGTDADKKIATDKGWTLA